MSVGGHGRQSSDKGIHTPFAWTFADASARTAFTPSSGLPALQAQLTSADLNRVALQVDNGTMWRLTATTPTWASVGGSSGSGDVTGPGSSTDNAVTRFDGTGGTTIQNSTVTLSDTGDFGGVRSADLSVLTGGSKPAHTQGRVFYDGDEHTLAVYNDDTEVLHQLGQAGLIRVYNNSGSTIVKGKPVYATGAEATEYRLTIGLAQAHTKDTSQALGVAMHDIENSTFGYITSWGLVSNFDTSAFSAGDDLYLSSTSAGGLSTIPATGIGAYEVRLGVVIRSHATLGKILVALAGTHVPSGDARQIVLPCQKDTAGTIAAGEVVRLVGYDSGDGVSTVELADASASGTMPGIGIARESITDTATGSVVVAGQLVNIDTSAWAVNDALYVSETTGALTNVKPQGTALVQRIAQVVRSHATLGVISIGGSGSNDLPNLAQNYVWAGDSNGVPQQVLHIGQGGTVHANATTSVAGFLSSTDKTKLDSVGSNADVAGPGSSTDNAITRFNGTGGKTIQNSTVTLGDSGEMAGLLTSIFTAEGDAGNSSTSITINFTTLGQKAKVTLTADTTLSFTFPGVGNYILKVIQDGTGGRAVTMPSSARAAGGTLGLAGAANAVTIWAIYYDGTNSYFSSMPGTGSGAPTVTLV